LPPSLLAAIAAASAFTSSIPRRVSSTVIEPAFGRSSQQPLLHGVRRGDRVSPAGGEAPFAGGAAQEVVGFRRKESSARARW
jgi:hypothetical protein